MTAVNIAAEGSVTETAGETTKAWPFDVTRAEPVNQWPVAQGPEPEPESGNVQPEIDHTLERRTVGTPATVTRAFGSPAKARPP